MSSLPEDFQKPDQNIPQPEYLVHKEPSLQELADLYVVKNISSEVGGNSVNNENASEDFDLTYTINTSRENKDIYIFKNVVVVLDRSGKNSKDIPEVLFGVFSDLPHDGAFSQPNTPIEGASMKYVAACVRKVAEDSGEKQLWFYPFGDDVEGEQKERREQARNRLFSRYVTLEPSPSGYGYIINT